MGDAAFWAGKRLGDLPAYRALAAGESAAEADRLGLPLVSGEVLLGVYTNPAGTHQAHVAITSAAVVVGDESGWGRMAYAVMAVFRLRGAKADWDSATIVAGDGTELPVHMPCEPYKPVTSLSGYLRKVSSVQPDVADRPVPTRAPAVAS